MQVPGRIKAGGGEAHYLQDLCATWVGGWVTQPLDEEAAKGCGQGPLPDSLGARQNWSLTRCVTWGQLLNLSVHPRSHQDWS